MDNPFEAPVASGASSSARDLADFMPAGHGARFAANLIDTVLVLVLFYMFAIVLGLAMRILAEVGGASLDRQTVETAISLPLLVSFFGFYLILGLIEGSSWQASPGKRLLGLRVIHASGRDIGMAEGVGRQFLKFFLLNLCGLAALVCLEEPAHRGLWDMLLSTRVVQRNRYLEI